MRTWCCGYGEGEQRKWPKIVSTGISSPRMVIRTYERAEKGVRLYSPAQSPSLVNLLEQPKFLINIYKQWLNLFNSIFATRILICNIQSQISDVHKIDLHVLSLQRELVHGNLVTCT